MSHSGRFVLRLAPGLHRQLSSEALRRGNSLNKLCTELIRQGLEGGRPQAEVQSFLSPLVERLKGHFGHHLEGIALFGSQVSGGATRLSDWDLLIVLSLPLTRFLYRWWDESHLSPPGKVVNPQFVHLPSHPAEAGSLWFEVASASEILWERKGRLGKFLDKIRKRIEEDKIRRYWLSGQPYWIHNQSEGASI